MRQIQKQRSSVRLEVSFLLWSSTSDVILMVRMSIDDFVFELIAALDLAANLILLPVARLDAGDVGEAFRIRNALGQRYLALGHEALYDLRRIGGGCGLGRLREGGKRGERYGSGEEEGLQGFLGGREQGFGECILFMALRGAHHVVAAGPGADSIFVIRQERGDFGLEFVRARR